MIREKTLGLVSWAGVLVLIAAFLGPVWKNFSHSVVGPFGGIDAILQTGLLEWSARQWSQIPQWLNLPIFYPVEGSLGFMDSLLGQAWLIAPFRWLFSPTVSAQYNLAYLGSLLLAAAGMAALWIASGGSRWASGVAALALIAAPYTHSQIGHLNQLPPPFVLFSLAALTAALRRQNAGLSTWLFWWLLAAGLVMQAAWGWYGFAYAVIGVVVLLIAWLAHRIRRQTVTPGLFVNIGKVTILPLIVAVAAVWMLAQPQLQLAERYPDFKRDNLEVRLGSADIQHFFNRGVYRSSPRDWVGQGKVGSERYFQCDRQVLHPGWLALGLFAVGWWRRGYLPFQSRRFGRSMLILGTVGLVFSFGDSLGLPGTDFRLSLPMEWLREIAPPFKAYRAAWRFSWLMVVALAWWSAVGAEQLVLKYRQGPRRWAAPMLPVILMIFVSLPAAIPSVEIGWDGHPAFIANTGGAVLTLPAPAHEYDEDRTEARWLIRSLVTGLPVTGGTSGWVPPEIKFFRIRLLECEAGREDPENLFHEMRSQGMARVEIAIRQGDDRRIEFWRAALTRNGAVRDDLWPVQGYEMYVFTSNP